jgi:hypothetical protein
VLEYSGPPAIGLGHLYALFSHLPPPLSQLEAQRLADSRITELVCAALFRVLQPHPPLPKVTDAHTHRAVLPDSRKPGHTTYQGCPSEASYERERERERYACLIMAVSGFWQTRGSVTVSKPSRPLTPYLFNGLLLVGRLAAAGKQHSEQVKVSRPRWRKGGMPLPDRCSAFLSLGIPSIAVSKSPPGRVCRQAACSRS